jgi:hypothetical protein
MRQTDSWDRKGKVKGTQEAGGIWIHPSFVSNLPSFYYFKCFYSLNNGNHHKNSFIGPNMIWDLFYSFSKCFASSRRNLCTIVLATSLISLLHTVLDGGPRKWTYWDPSKPMTYQHAPRHRVHKYTMSFGDAILYLSRFKSFLNTFKCLSNTSCQVFLIQAWQQW